MGLTGVKNRAVGDEVFGLAPGCLGSAVVVPAGLMVHKPAGLTFEQAATAPTVYITVQAAFEGDRGMDASSKVRIWSSAALPGKAFIG